MSSTKYVKGLVPDNERIRAMREVYDSCRALGIEPPDEVGAVFDSEDYIEGLGKTLNIETYEGHNDQSMEWLVIKLDELPPNIHALAFIESW